MLGLFLSLFILASLLMISCAPNQGINSTSSNDSSGKVNSELNSQLNHLGKSETSDEQVTGEAQVTVTDIIGNPAEYEGRMVILAAEDIGLANPNALLLANACYQSVHAIGFPEARIILSETAIYLATSEKSNSAYQAIGKAQEMVKDTGDLSVPLEIRNAPTQLMKELGYGDNYQYAHSFKGHFAAHHTYKG